MQSHLHTATFRGRHTENMLVVLCFGCFMAVHIRSANAGTIEQYLYDPTNAPKDQDSTYDSTPLENSYCRIHTGDYLPTGTAWGGPDLYRLRTCYLCLEFIYEIPLLANLLDRRNQTLLRRVCSLTSEHTPELCMSRVSECCKAAEECCETQKVLPLSLPGFCPITWDGFTCVNFTAAGQIAQIDCPTFVRNFPPHPHAFKRCDTNAKWEMRSDYKMNMTWEPSQYEGCIDAHKKDELILMRIKMTFYFVSLFFLVVSKIIFLSFKVLRDQPRIRIHVNLFVALTLYTVCALISLYFIEMSAYSTMKDSHMNHTTALSSGGNWCKAIIVANRYFQDTTFLWVFCEALFLYRLLTNTFQQKPSITIYCLIGWGFPGVWKALYIILRATLPQYSDYDVRCWVEDTLILEWVSRGPNVICLLVNIIFLIIILRLLSSLSPQHDDSNTFRRSLRATFILMPLFGLQCLFVIVQLRPRNPHYFRYGVVQNVVKGSHGLTVALVFCIFNHEVINVVRKCFQQHTREALNGYSFRIGGGSASGTNFTSFRSRSAVSLPLRPSVQSTNYVRDIHDDGVSPETPLTARR